MLGRDSGQPLPVMEVEVDVDSRHCFDQCFVLVNENSSPSFQVAK